MPKYLIICTHKSVFTAPFFSERESLLNSISNIMLQKTCCKKTCSCIIQIVRHLNNPYANYLIAKLVKIQNIRVHNRSYCPWLFCCYARCPPRAAWTPAVCGRRGGWHLWRQATFQERGRSLPAAWKPQWTATISTWVPHCSRRLSSIWRPTYIPLWPR